MHILGGWAGNGSYVRGCSVQDSFFRAVTVHGTNEAHVERLVAYNVAGNAVYMEDGLEERNVIEFNLVARVMAIGAWAAGGAQVGERFCAGCVTPRSGYQPFTRSQLVQGADTAASPFYFPNMYNVVRGNVASGGWSGFSFPNMPRAMGLATGSGVSNAQPINRPVLEMHGNIAHSSGTTWPTGASIYLGGELQYREEDDVNSGITYNSGRVGRRTRWPDGSDVPTFFNDTRTHLCQ